VYKTGEYQYIVHGMKFDVRELAALLPGDFKAGTTPQEHKSLMKLAVCHKPLTDLVWDIT
jgi:hypothetical protein